MKFIKIFAAIIIIVGIGLFSYGIIAHDGDFSSLRDIFLMDDRYEEVTQTGSATITSVEIVGRDHRIEFFRSEGDNYFLSYYNAENDYFEFTIEDGVLNLKANPQTLWFHGWGYKSTTVATVNVYLPANFTGDIDVSTTTGSIKLINYGQLERLHATVTTGSITVQNVSIDTSLRTSSTVGTIKLQNVQTPSVNLVTTTGSIEVKDCTITTLLKTVTTVGTILIQDVITPRIEVTSTTGSTTIQEVDTTYISAATTTGSVRIELTDDESEYRVEVSTTIGSVQYQGIAIANQATINPSGSKEIHATTTTGSIRITISD